MLVVPVVGCHVVSLHVPKFVNIRDGEVLTRGTQRVGHRRPIDVPVASVRWIPLGRFVQGRVVGPHRVRPAWVSPGRLDAVCSPICLGVHLGEEGLVTSRQSLGDPGDLVRLPGDRPWASDWLMVQRLQAEQDLGSAFGFLRLRAVSLLVGCLNVRHSCQSAQLNSQMDEQLAEFFTTFSNSWQTRFYV